MESRSRFKRLALTVPLALLAITGIVFGQTMPGYTITPFAHITGGARDVATDAAGNVYSMGRDSGLIYKATPAGALAVLASLGAGFYVGPHYDPATNSLLITTCNFGPGAERFYKVDANSGALSTYQTGRTCSGGFASDAAGNIYASVFVAAGSIIKITPGGAISTYATGLSFPDGIDFGPGGELYVGNRATNQIMRVAPGGGVATVFASGGGINQPLGVLADSAGFVYVANYGSGVISKISPAGVVSTLGTGFGNPVGIAFDPSGSMFIANFSGTVVYKVIGVAPPTPTDSTPPTITPSITGTLGSGGWYVSNVGVSWTVTDADTAITSSTGCGAESVTTDTTGITLTCSATSTGGTASASVTIRRDVTAPAITVSATAGGNPYSPGTWTNNDVTVTWSCSDNTSGVASYSSPVTVSAEGGGQSASGSCSDAAGHVSGVAFSGINIDKTAPAITGMPATGTCSMWPPNHKMITVATVSTTDSGSGAGSFTVAGASNEPDNGLGDGDTAGDISITGVNPKTIALRAERAGGGNGRVYTLNASATDLAGNLTVVTSTCTVPRNQGK